MTNLNPVIAMALAPFAPPVEIDTKTLANRESDLRNARKQYDSKPDSNPDKQTWAAEIAKLARDIEELKAGVAREDLTSVKNWRMPAWGSYGT
jgi:hypothetical protein